MTSATFDDTRPLGARDVRTLVLAALGGALEFYDFVVFGFFVGTIGGLFFPKDDAELQLLLAWGIFAAGYLARPLGGIVMAHFGDLVGRKRMFVFSVFLMAVPTLLIGLMPTYATIGIAAPILLLLFRIAQGAAIGGEAPGAWVFVSEHVPAGRVGLACGMLTGGLTFGIVLGSLMALFVNASFDAAAISNWAWRIPFLFGGALGIVAMYLRRFLSETPVFEAMRAEAAQRRLPLADALRGHWRETLISILASWMLTAAIVVLILITPTVMPRVFGVPQIAMSWANVAATLALTAGCVLTGMALDRFGTRPVMAVMGAAMVASAYLFYLGVARDPGLVLPLYALCGFCVGMVTVVPYAMVRAFPPAVRFSGVSFSYNLAYAVFGALTPPLVQWLLKQDPIAPVHYVAVATAIGGAAVLAFAKKG